MDSQRLQTLDADLACERAGEELQERGPGLAEASDPANGACEEPRWEDATGVIHHDRIDGPEEHADEGDGDGASDEGRDKPYDELEPALRGKRACKLG